MYECTYVLILTIDRGNDGGGNNGNKRSSNNRSTLVLVLGTINTNPPQGGPRHSWLDRM